MLITYNEIVTMINKCVNSLHLPIGETDRIAQMTADLELIHFSGIEHFVNALENISTDIPHISVDNTDKNIIDIDLKDSSIVLHLPSITYYARQRLLNQDSITLNIQNARNRWLSYGCLKKNAEHGYNVRAKWSRRGVDETVYYFIKSKAEHPDLYIEKTSHPSSLLEITIQKTDFVLPNPDINTRHISAYNLATEREKSIIHGANIDDTLWHRLVALSKKNLVANSELSETQGAGGV